jgi:hypothetical protein
MLDSLATKLLKLWWRYESFLERWKRVVVEQEADPYLPPDVPRPRQGPYQVVIYGDSAKSKIRDRWRAAAGLAIGILIGFIAGSALGKTTAQVKLEARVKSLESRITE